MHYATENKRGKYAGDKSTKYIKHIFCVIRKKLLANNYTE